MPEIASAPRRPGRYRAALKGAVTTFFLLAPILAAQAKPQAENQALQLKQWSRLLGKSELIVCKKGVRLFIPARQVILLMKPPEWNVYFINLQTKVYSISPAATWRSPMAATASMFRPGDPSAMKSVSYLETTLDGLAVRKHSLQAAESGISRSSPTWQKLLVKSGTLYVISDRCYSKNIAIVLGRTFGTVQDAGIPVSLHCVDHRGEEQDELKLSEQSLIAINDSDWLVPKNFRQVANPTEASRTEYDNGFADLIK